MSKSIKKANTKKTTKVVAKKVVNGTVEPNVCKLHNNASL